MKFRFLLLTISVFFRRETRPKILWNTGSKLQAAKDKMASGAVVVVEATPVKVPCVCVCVCVCECVCVCVCVSVCV